MSTVTHVERLVRTLYAYTRLLSARSISSPSSAAAAAIFRVHAEARASSTSASVALLRAAGTALTSRDSISTLSQVLSRNFIQTVELRADALRAGPSANEISNILGNALRLRIQNASGLSLMPVLDVSDAQLIRKVTHASRIRSPHPVQNEREMCERIQHETKRIFVGTNPQLLGDIPGFLVETSLCEEIPRDITEMHYGRARGNFENSSKYSVMVPYSAVATHDGLTGLGLGRDMVIEAARKWLSGCERRRFVTLSPVPSLRTWVEQRGVPNTRKDIINAAWEVIGAHRGIQQGAVDPVANFHLGNGAEIAKVVWSADESARRMKESFGVMVCYEYKLETMVHNARGYASRGQLAIQSNVGIGD